MNAMKKLFALLLALALVMSLAVPAMAADDNTTVGTEEKPSLTITDKYAGHTYEAYQIFSGDAHAGRLASINWGSGFDATQAADFVADLAKEFGGDFLKLKADSATLASDIADLLTSWEDNDGSIRKFVQILHTKDDSADGYKYLITDAAIVSTCTEFDVTNEDGTTGKAYKYTFDEGNLDAGYYMVKDKDGTVEDRHDFYTRLLLRVVGVVSIKPKGDVPSVNKSVTDTIDGSFYTGAAAGVNDTVYFKLTGTLPSNLKQDYTSYKYTFKDTMSENLVFLNTEKYPTGVENNPYYDYAGIVSMKVIRTNAPAVTLTLTKDPDAADDNENRLNLLYNSSNEKNDINITVTNDGHNVTIEFVDILRSFPNLLASDKFEIIYAAKLTGGAQPGVANNNQVVLEYSNNPQGVGTGTTPEGEAKVYTFGMTVDKVNSSGEKLAGAQFMLYERAHGDGNDELLYRYAILEPVTGEGITVPTYKIKDWIVLSAPIFDEAVDYVELPAGTPNYAINEAKEPITDVSGNGLNADGERDKSGKILFDTLVFATDATGSVNIQGIDTGVFFLQELNAPTAYNKLRIPAEISISANVEDGTIKNFEIKKDSVPGSVNTATGTGTISILNGMGPELPETGGIGTTIFYVAGGLLVVAAITLLITKKRMSEK